MKICEAANELDPHQYCLKRLGQSEEAYKAAVNAEWTEEQEETPRVGKTFKWSEVDSQRLQRRRRTAAPAAKRRRLTKILVATEPAPSSPKILTLCQQSPNIPPLAPQQAISQQAYCAHEVEVTAHGVTGAPLTLPFISVHDRVPAAGRGGGGWTLFSQRRIFLSITGDLF
ncbi:hypothetical protein N7527_003162 [Penicillium freii]|nr:hypothetical protein N7527_003162 [Penicillium freii]